MATNHARRSLLPPVIGFYLIVVVFAFIDKVHAAPPVTRVAELRSGVMLVAARKLNDPNFGHSVVLLTYHSVKGTLGIMTNKTTRIPVSATAPNLNGVLPNDATIRFGGPVQLEAVRVLMQMKTSVDGVDRVVDDTYIVNRPETVDDLLNNNRDNIQHVNFYAGHAGWGPGQLEQEIARGDWHLIEGSNAIVFDERTAGTWEDLIEQLDGQWVHREYPSLADNP